VTFDAELALRVVAAVAAVALVASPLVVGAWGKARALLSRVTPPPADAALEDMTTILEIANRLRIAKCEDGVDLCEKLISVMLAASPKE
jgi:hypothetical protein